MLITSNKQQRGFSLVEVLIALIIMSVGMLGIAGLYVQSMQAGRTKMSSIRDMNGLNGCGPICQLLPNTHALINAAGIPG